MEAIYNVLDQGGGLAWAGGSTFEAIGSIKLAIEEAKSADQLPATRDHLLLGIILLEKNTAGAALINAGISADDMREFIRKSRAESQ
jgi:hypothetical protein